MFLLCLVQVISKHRFSSKHHFLLKLRYSKRQIHGKLWFVSPENTAVICAGSFNLTAPYICMSLDNISRGILKHRSTSKIMYHSHIYKEFNHTIDCPMILLFISWRARERRAASSTGDWNRESDLSWRSSCEDFICVLLFLLLLRVLVRNDTLGGIRLGWNTICKNAQNYLQCR